MTLKERILRRFTEKVERRSLMYEQSAKLTVFKDDLKPEPAVHIRHAKINLTEYPVVEREIVPAAIICPDCGGITLEGLDYCDKCGGELVC